MVNRPTISRRNFLSKTITCTSAISIALPTLGSTVEIAAASERENGKQKTDQLREKEMKQIKIPFEVNKIPGQVDVSIRINDDPKSIGFSALYRDCNLNCVTA